MKIVWIAAVVLAPVLAMTAATPQQDSGKDMSWAYPAYPATDKNLPASDESVPRRVPGSAKTYTMEQIDDLMNPPDWYPDEHPPAPHVVTHGGGPGVMGCGACHLMSGSGHPESATLSGLNPAYMERELADFKSGARTDRGRMITIAKGLSAEDAQQAAEYFASLKPVQWVKVVEAQTVPKSFVNGGRMRLPMPGEETEPLGNRIIELPVDPELVLDRDPHSGFTAYVPVGSVETGEKLVTTGGAGKTIPCSICHGPSLMGLGEVPRIAGLHPIYIVRQLYNFKNGDRSGSSAALMKGVVANLDDEDIVDLAAYVSSKNPAH
jgi:cytochrome c553